MANAGDNVHPTVISKRGPFIIINNETVAKKEKREGTEHDVKKLKETFGGTFGFEVVVHNNKKADEIRGIIQNLADGDYSTCECIGIAILTHGKQGQNSVKIVYGCDGGEVDLDEVFKPLKTCKSLAGKPKLILVQAGPLQVDDHKTPVKKTLSAVGIVNEVNEAYSVPVTSEFSYYFALDVPAGRNEWKFKDNGSIFIQKFCRILLENSDGKFDVESLKILANDEILTISGEMPVSEMTLTREFYLRAA